MKRYLIDTNIILRFLMKDDAEQFAKSSALFLEASQERCVLWIGWEVLAETVWALRAYFDEPRDVIAVNLTKLIHPPAVDCDRKAVLLDALERYRSSSLDIVDCLLAAEAAQSGDLLATFDKGIGKKFADVKLWDHEGSERG